MPHESPPPPEAPQRASQCRTNTRNVYIYVHISSWPQGVMPIFCGVGVRGEGGDIAMDSQIQWGDAYMNDVRDPKGWGDAV